MEMEYKERNDSLVSDQESEKVEIYLQCRNIQASNIVVDAQLLEGNKPIRTIYSSKPIKVNSQKVDLPNTIVLQYFFEYRQKLTLVAFDVSNGSRIPIGRAETTVGELFNAGDKGVTKPLQSSGKTAAEIHIKCQKVDRGTQGYIEFDLLTRNLAVGSAFLCFGEGTARWKLFKIKQGQQIMLYESEIKPGKTNRYSHLKIRQSKLCNNNVKQPIIIRFYEDNSSSIIGETNFELATLLQGKNRLTITKKGSEKGLVFFQNFKQTVKYDFTDFLSAGMEMSLVCCIDFTASNGIQHAPSSLHYFNPNKRSQYEEALHQVCTIVLDYDTDKLVPCFGFGAKVDMPTFSSANKAHMCFPINGNQANPNLYHIAGITQGYRQCLPHLQFSGPTYFAPLLREAMTVCQALKSQQKSYMLLLILTDGVIHDKQQVKDLLVKCGRLPLSVIIIGIGNGDDWSAMHQLDDDDCQMFDKQGNKSIRDLVQFVEFQKHNNNGIELAKEVLEELPRQVVEYHQICGITPNNYRNKDKSNKVAPNPYQSSYQQPEDALYQKHEYL